MIGIIDGNQAFSKNRRINRILSSISLRDKSILEDCFTVPHSKLEWMVDVVLGEKKVKTLPLRTRFKTDEEFNVAIEKIEKLEQQRNTNILLKCKAMWKQMSHKGANLQPLIIPAEFKSIKEFELALIRARKQFDSAILQCIERSEGLKK